MINGTHKSGQRFWGDNCACDILEKDLGGYAHESQHLYQKRKPYTYRVTDLQISNIMEFNEKFWRRY